jgi:hypothetical protein
MVKSDEQTAIKAFFALSFCRDEYCFQKKDFLMALTEKN